MPNCLRSENSRDVRYQHPPVALLWGVRKDLTEGCRFFPSGKHHPYSVNTGSDKPAGAADPPSSSATTTRHIREDPCARTVVP